MGKKDLPGSYRLHRAGNERALVLDSMIAASWRHNVQALLEIDVTDARRAIHKARREHGKKMSFLAWIMTCIGKACSAHPRVHAWRQGRRKLVSFQDVDLGTYVEREVNGEFVPTPVVIRKVNEKSPEEIFAEIQKARTQSLDAENGFLGENQKANRLTRIAMFFPRFIRMLVWRRIMSNGFLAKRIMGTVGVTSLGMYGKATAWPIPSGIRTLNIALGPVVKKPGLVGDKIVPRDHLCLTVVADHDIVDGAPIARFLSYLTRIIRTAWGLEKYLDDKTGKGVPAGEFQKV